MPDGSQDATVTTHDQASSTVNYSSITDDPNITNIYFEVQVLVDGLPITAPTRCPVSLIFDVPFTVPMRQGAESEGEHITVALVSPGMAYEQWVIFHAGISID